MKIKLSFLIFFLLLFLCYFIARRTNRQSVLRQMAIDVFRTFNDLGVIYWADFGTLLGIIRDDDIISHDDDVDVCIVDNKQTHVLMETSVRSRLESLGYTLKRLNWSAYRVYSQFGLFTDVYLTTVKGDTIIGATGENSNISKRLVGLTNIHSWKGLDVHVPEHVHETLVWRYGETYMTPIKGFKGRDS